ncbi:MAG TPA: hypothetical protein VMU84_10365, partial [Thermoanaerobaculia bacterium]|nr:hypothetical protein [Thermoanaerobaculia bacterium]
MAAVSRELIYWPRGKEYSVAWILSINVYFVIAGWRGPHQPLLVTDSLPASAVGRSAFVLLLLVLG